MGQKHTVHVTNDTNETLEITFKQKGEARTAYIKPKYTHREVYETSAWTHVWCDLSINGNIVPFVVLEGSNGDRNYVVKNDGVYKDGVMYREF